MMETAAVTETLNGLLSFPITPFDADDGLDERRLRQHVRLQLDFEPSAIFTACGTGEFFSLTAAEHQRTVAVVVDEVGGRVPVFAGVGYGTATAVEMARASEGAGADGLLAMPPYLVFAEQEGLIAHFTAVAAATRLPTVIYHRDNAQLEAATVVELARIDTIVGLKDGVGDFTGLQRMRELCPPDFPLVGGLPTAELEVLRYREVGIRGYSSAVFNFVPELSVAFRAALDAGREDTVKRYLVEFFEPFAELRDEVQGFAVALVKSAVGMRYGDAGEVRPPLLQPGGAHAERLAELIDRGLALVRSDIG